MRVFVIFSLLLLPLALARDSGFEERDNCRRELCSLLPPVLTTLRGAPVIDVMARIHTALWRWVRTPCSMVDSRGAIPKLDLVFMQDSVDPSFGDKQAPGHAKCRKRTVEWIHAATVFDLKQCANDPEQCHRYGQFTALAQQVVEWEDNPCHFVPLAKGWVK